MTFLAPLAALLTAAIAIPTLLVFYFLKLRRREMAVSSTLLWKRAVQDLQVNAPFQKLRKNLLLLLQMLLLLALLLALARPTWRGMGQSGQRLVIVIDQSASMNATDVAPTRLEAAKKWALKKVDEFEGAGGVMVVSLARQARVVQPFTGDRALLRAAIEAIGPTDQAGYLAPAMQLIEPYALSGKEGEAGTGLEVAVVSDGRFGDTTDLALRGGRLEYVRMARDLKQGGADNVGFVSMSARRNYDKPTKVQVFAKLRNSGAQGVKLNVNLLVDEQVRSVTEVEVPGAAGETGQAGERAVHLELSVPGAATVTLAHDHADQLEADNVVGMTLAPPRQLSVLMVGEENVFIRRAAESVGLRKMTVMSPKKYEDQDPARLKRSSDDVGFDLVIFDGYTPTQMPVVNSVSFQAGLPMKGLEVKKAGEKEPRTQVFLNWRREHELLRHVALDDVLLVEPGRLVLPAQGVVLATAQGGPVLAEVGGEGTRHVVTSFGVLQTNWPMQVSFAVFVSNCLEVLGLSGSGAQGRAFLPGEVAQVQCEPDARVVRYEGPAALEAKAAGGQAVLPMFERVGMYEAKAGAVSPWERIAVNLTDAVESDLRPAEQLQVGTIKAEAVAGDATIRREVWPWLAWAALGFLVVEWVVYTRRMHL